VVSNSLFVVHASSRCTLWIYFGNLKLKILLPFLLPTQRVGATSSFGSSEVLNLKKNKSEIYVTTDGQSANLSWCQAHIWGPKIIFLLLSHSCGFVDVGRPLCRENGSFTIAAGLRQRSHSRVRVPRES
jgi:hypothetical protein